MSVGGVIRSEAVSGTAGGPRTRRFLLILLEVGDFPMMRKQLRGMKERAQTLHGGAGAPEATR